MKAEHYRRLPYRRRARLEIGSDGKNFWVAWIDELPGCQIDAPTKAEAYRKLDELFEDYIAAKLEWGDKVPRPARPWRLTEDGDLVNAPSVSSAAVRVTGKPHVQVPERKPEDEREIWNEPLTFTGVGAAS